MEKELLGAVLADRSTWEEVVRLGKEDGSSFSDLGKVLWKHASAYYKRDQQAREVSRDVLLGLIKSSTNDKTYEVLKDVINSLPKPSLPNIRECYIRQQLDICGQLLSSSLLGHDANKQKELWERWGKLAAGQLPLLSTSRGLDLYDSEDRRCLFDVINKEGLMRLRPLALNEKLDGGACKGDHILISGRVENGKSLVAINMAAGLAHDGYRGMYVGNEDGPRRMRPRFLSRFSGMTKHEMAQDLDKALFVARENGYDNIVFAGQAPASPLSPVAEALENGKYDFLVVDQIRNIASEDDNKAGKLEDAAVGMRDLCKKYDVLGISVTQSLNSSLQINKLVCDMGDVADSKHGLPGQADLIIMLGTNEEFRDKNQIMVSIVKNKLTGWHGYFACTVNPHLSKVMEE